MKLLLDENLSRRIVFASGFPGELAGGFGRLGAGYRSGGLAVRKGFKRSRRGRCPVQRVTVLDISSFSDYHVSTVRIQI